MLLPQPTTVLLLLTIQRSLALSLYIRIFESWPYLNVTTACFCHSLQQSFFYQFKDVLALSLYMRIFERGAYLNVTTAWSVVLLPSSQPFGRIPGDPQFISKYVKIFASNTV
jgi:hypothetical protein